MLSKTKGRRVPCSNLWWKQCYMSNSFYNMNVRDVLFVMGVMAPCSCQGSPFSTKEFTQILDLEKKKEKRW